MLTELRYEINLLRQSRNLLAMMTRRELASRFAGATLGWIWLYAQPLLTVAAYYLVFDVVFKARLGANAPTTSVGTYLIAGMLPWMAFSEALSRAMNALLEAGPLLQKNPLPPGLFPARAVAATTVTYLPLLVLVSAIYGIAGGFTSAWLLLPILLIGQFLLAFLLGYALALLAAALRDVLQVVGFLLSLGVFVSPVLFPLSMFPEQLRWVLWLNPMTPFVLGIQSILLTGDFPDVSVWVGMSLWLLGSSMVLAVLLRRSRDFLVDWL